MQLILKAAISLIVIFAATGIGKKFPSVSGLIAVMPLTGALVLIWVYLENKGESEIMQNFTKGALLGLIPTILFFATSFFCFKKGFPLYSVILLSFGVWLAAAVMHHVFLR